VRVGLMGYSDGPDGRHRAPMFFPLR
jgi:hypothetical protein